MVRLHKKNIAIALSAFALLIAIVLTGLHIYNRDLKADLSKHACDTVNKTLEQQRYSFYMQIKEEIITLEVMANALSYLPSDNKTIARNLADICHKTKFQAMILSDLNGDGVSEDGNTINIANRDYFKRAKSGYTVIGEPIRSRKNNIDILVPIATPLYKDRRIVGVLTGFYNLKTFNELLLNITESDGYVYVTDKKGDIIGYFEQKDGVLSELDENKNFFAAFNNVKTISYDKLEDILFNMKEDKSGHAIWDINGQVRSMHYKPLGLNDWYIFSLANQEDVMINAHSSTRDVALGLLGIIFAVLLFFILKQQSSQTKELEKIAYYDRLTKIANFDKFVLDTKKILKNNPEKQFLCLQFDVFQFKLINELFTAEIGDKVLQTLASTLVDLEHHLAPEHIVIARINSDKFIIFRSFAQMDSVDSVRCDFIDKINKNMDFLHHFKLDIRVGRYVTMPGDTVDEIVERVNLANRMAKESGFNSCVDYIDEYKELLIEKTDIRNKMEYALNTGEFKVYLQGKYRLSDESLCGAEALARWQDSSGRLLPPVRFIPVLEENGFIVKLDLYMFTKCCEILVEWRDKGLVLVPISVNFSRKHLADNILAQRLYDIVKSYNLEPHYIEIEFTETVALENEEILRYTLKSLHDKGFVVSMDDFGTGYSSLGLLKSLDIDIIKFDKSFFASALEEERAYAVVSNMINMTIDLNMQAVAEGVEDKEQIDILKRLNCDVVQGYYFCRPMPYSEFQALLQLAADVKSVDNGALKSSTKSQLRKNQELLMATMDTMPLCFNLWDRDFNNVQCNKAAVQLFDLKDEKEYLERFFELSPEYQPDGRKSSEKAIEFITRAFNEGMVVFEWTHRKLNGQRIPTEITLVRIKNKGNLVVAGYTRDLRAQIEAKSAVDTANERMRVLIDAAPLCINLWNKEFQNILCNKAASKLFDLKDEQEYLDRFFDLSPIYQPDGRKSSEKALELIVKAFADGTAVFEWMHQKLNGEQIPAEISLVRIKLHDEYFVAGFTRDLREIQSTLALNEQLTILAHFDHLTGCLSRSAFIPMLEQELQKPENVEGFPLIIFDIDRFKKINDSFGHNAGDEALRQVVAAVKAVLPVDAVFCRYGGDEFIILPGKMDRDSLKELLDIIYVSVRQIKIQNEQYCFGTTISAGAAYYSQDYKEASELIYQADIALYEAKKRGRDNYLLEIKKD